MNINVNINTNTKINDKGIQMNIELIQMNKKISGFIKDLTKRKKKSI